MISLKSMYIDYVKGLSNGIVIGSVASRRRGCHIQGSRYSSDTNVQSRLSSQGYIVPIPFRSIQQALYLCNAVKTKVWLTEAHRFRARTSEEYIICSTE